MRAQQAEAQVKDLTKQLEESKQREEQLRDQVAKVEPNTETGSLQKIKSAAAAANSEPERATAMLTLAMQLHDQYVDKGKATAKEITEQAQRKYEELISKANDYSNRTRSEPTITMPAPARLPMPTVRRLVTMPIRTAPRRMKMPTHT